MRRLLPHTKLTQHRRLALEPHSQLVAPNGHIAGSALGAGRHRHRHNNLGQGLRPRVAVQVSAVAVVGGCGAGARWGQQRRG